MTSRRTSAQRTGVRRIVTAGALLAVAVGLGVVVLERRGPDERRTVERYARAWQREDWEAMRALTTSVTRDRYGARAFARAFTTAAATATGQEVSTATPVPEGSGHWRLPVEVRTRVFGPVTGDVRLDVITEGDRARISWQPDLAFPGLRAGERLGRTTVMPARAALLARDGTPLAQGPSRTSPLGAAARAIAGSIGPIPADRQARSAELGYPADAQVGLSGLERIFDRRLAGTPGGELWAGARLLARRAPRAAAPVRTTIAPAVQTAAVAALAGRFGGIVALRPRSGEILAAAGIAFSALQPPGSTFKIITAAGALAAGITRPSDRFPVQTSATLSGVELQNADHEACGGSLAQAFAMSCNSVFAPLGVRLGARRLVAAAQRFGFNRPTGIDGAATASIPPAAAIGDDLALGSTAIGQGRVQATALQMAIVAATIGLRGERPAVTVDTARWPGAAPLQRATSSRVARQVERLMLGVVRVGTGTATAIPGVRVAGKTGTAELRTTQTCAPAAEATADATPTVPDPCEADEQPDPSDTDAWFTAYAPAGDGHPRIAVAVLLIGAGAGGDTAAPAARPVLMAGLQP